MTEPTLTQLGKFKHAAHGLETDDDEASFDEKTRKLMKQSERTKERRSWASSPPGWSFTVEEVSAGVYCAKGCGPRRMTVEHRSTDHEEALERAKEYAAEMSQRLGLSNT